MPSMRRSPPRRMLALVPACALVLMLAAVFNMERPSSSSPQELLQIVPRSMLSNHWGGVGSEGYGTASWDNSGWNAHYHPRDGASMNSESMEPYFWRKGPRVNDEYVGHMADGDPVFNPPDDWEPPVNFYRSQPVMLKGLKRAPAALQFTQLGTEYDVASALLKHADDMQFYQNAPIPENLLDLADAAEEEMDIDAQTMGQ
eukprot:CAMPEP_0181310750 /NCGR_PEP_ID=MMETSP1101-20121128/12758_1 /TAXON_ID=46948 /ORGANISM="Rhodomonas abbreviata, Strain Caron Lab Isolate" /LENGTH=200 /DNA_ID=CAMNT_0023417411 /DNA_START=41 /DNA_END=643 /DNA_ORIENTATION=-